MTAFVGSFVGFFVGFLGLPDKHSPFTARDLDGICRVSTTGESSGGFEFPIFAWDGLE